MRRLTIDITDQQHQQLKAMAALEGKSMKQYAMERLFPSQSDEGQAWLELKALVHKRIESGDDHEVLQDRFSTTVDGELNGKAWLDL